MRILAISGSLRADSHNPTLLRRAGAPSPPASSSSVGRPARRPAFDEDATRADVARGGRLRAAMADADAVLIATPEYNGSIPGALKNALDWVSRPFATRRLRGKPVAVIGASTGSFGGVWAQAEARKVLGLMGARVVGASSPSARRRTGWASPTLSCWSSCGRRSTRWSQRRAPAPRPRRHGKLVVNHHKLPGLRQGRASNSS